MSRVITFPTVFPSYHSRKGEQTYFVEKIWKGLFDIGLAIDFTPYETEYQKHFPCQYTQEENVSFQAPKFHTIRAGNRWEVGDKFSPRIWSGKPYNSKQLQFAPDIEIKKVWDFKIMLRYDGFVQPILLINDNPFLIEQHQEMLAANDGLSLDDMQSWFIPAFKKFKPYTGQIISWNENINY